MSFRRDLALAIRLMIYLCSVYTPCLYVMNKIDAITIEELDLVARVPHYVPIAAGKVRSLSFSNLFALTLLSSQEWNFDELLERIWQYLNMIRMSDRVGVGCSFSCVQLHQAQRSSAGL